VLFRSGHAEGRGLRRHRAADGGARPLRRGLRDACAPALPPHPRLIRHAPPRSETAAHPDLDLAGNLQTRFGGRGRRTVGAAGGEEREKPEGLEHAGHGLTEPPRPAMEVEIDGVTLTPSGVSGKAAWPRGWEQPATRRQSPTIAATLIRASPSSGRSGPAPALAPCRRNFAASPRNSVRRGRNRPPA